ncbi:MAG: penicillin-binding transpeptidase domain-containing protein [Phascolarctobacterium sp.]|nr:penicillin-binding transpeptidase domain-containing protein [Phascolarctobacterium sp.]
MKGPFTIKDGKKRGAFMLMIIFVMFGAVVLRLIWVQFFRGEEMKARLEQQLVAKEERFTPRGKIMDRNGDELAVSLIAKTLIADPKMMYSERHPERNYRLEAAEKLAPILKISKEELLKDFSEPDRRYLRVARAMDQDVFEKVDAIINNDKDPIPGFYYEEESKRYYTKKRVAAQVLGFVGDEDKGVYGIEAELDSILRGARVHKTMNTDRGGTQIYGDGSEKNDRVDTTKLSTVYLTLDSKIQYALEEAMDDAMARTNARGAAAVIMDPYTGEILGMVSRPTFDPNNYGEYSQESWVNKSISMIYEPGSVFKPLVGCMGLSEGTIGPGTMFNDAGSIRIADRVIQNWDGEGMGYVPFSDAIKWSINTIMVQVGMELGAKRMIDYSKKFGFGTETGIDLPGEESGILYKAEDMWQPDIATMSIGQGIAVTPIQVLRAISAIANGGELLQPYIVKRIVAPNGEIIREGHKKVVRNMITPQIAEQMRNMMEAVVASGGGKRASIKGYRIAGKTGTAQKISASGGYAEGQYIASFVGFVPADKPKYSMIVMLDTPRGKSIYGSQVAAPVFKSTLQQVLVAKGIQPSSNEGLRSLDEANSLGTKKKQAVKIPQINILPNGKIKLPDFKGLDMRNVQELLQKGHLKLKPYGSGEAYNQKPAPGQEVDENTTVEIWFN